MFKEDRLNRFITEANRNGKLAWLNAGELLVFFVVIHQLLTSYLLIPKLSDFVAATLRLRDLRVSIK